MLVNVSNSIPYLVLSNGAKYYYGFSENDPWITGRPIGITLPASTWNDSRRESFAYIADMFEAEYPAVADE